MCACPTQSTERRPAIVAEKTVGRRPRGRPKVRPDSEQSETIIRSALALFVARGYGQTTMDDIAAHCNVSKRTIYRLFAGKSELFAAIVRMHRPSMLDLPGNYEGVPAGEALERIFQVDLDPAAEMERLALLRLVHVESAQYPELREIMTREGAVASHADLAAWLAARTAAGELAVDDARVCARILMDMIFGALAMNGPDFPETLVGRDRARHLRRCISIFLHGVARDA